MLSIVITGSPGVGKHTLAKYLEKKMDLEFIDINKLAIQTDSFVKKDDVLDVDIKALQKIVDKEISRKSLLVGHLAPYVVSRKNVAMAIVLRRSPYKLISVYKKRKYSLKKIMENLGSEILGIIFYDALKKFGPQKTFQFDTTSSSIPVTAEKIQSLLVRGRFHGDKVDWLDLILKNGDLNRFFPTNFK